MMLLLRGQGLRTICAAVELCYFGFVGDAFQHILKIGHVVPRLISEIDDGPAAIVHRNHTANLRFKALQIRSRIGFHAHEYISPFPLPLVNCVAIGKGHFKLGVCVGLAEADRIPTA